jgi:hypothetical protein
MPAPLRVSAARLTALLAVGCSDGMPPPDADGAVDASHDVDASRDLALPADRPDLAHDLGGEDGGPQAPSCALDPLVRFVDVAAEAGLGGVLAGGGPPGECFDDLIAGAATVADFDRDGDHDLFFPLPRGPDRLYRNEGNGTFVDVAEALGVAYEGPSAAAVFLDIDGDGDLDLFVSSGARETNRLYVHGPDGFTEEAVARGASVPLSSPFLCSYQVGVAAGDADGDGDLDLLLASWEDESGPASDRTRLLINEGGTFTDGTEATGIAFAGQAAHTPAFGDVDGDGVMDIAIASDWRRSRLYRGNGDGTFADVTEAAGVGTDENGMGSVLADLDQDGDLDWFVTSIYESRRGICDELWGDCDGNRLFLGNGDGAFVDATDAAGVRDGAWGWGAVAIDFDHDGDLDLLQENGSGLIGSFWDDAMRLFRNEGSMRFSERGCEHGLAIPGVGKSILPIDYDDDGDLDLFVARTFGEPLLLRNDGAHGRAWLRVRLDQPGPNPDGVGATVVVEGGERALRRGIHLNPGFGGPAAPEAHFGLGDHEGTVSVVVRWPDGATQRVEDVSVGQLLRVERE